MTQQAEELRELIREANGVRKDLERERREFVRARQDAEKFAATYVDSVRADIEAKLSEEIGKLIDESNVEIQRGAVKALKLIRTDFETLRDMLLGKRPVPDDVAAEWSIQAGWPDHGARYHPDLQAIAKAWPSLTAEQRELCTRIISGDIESKELAEVCVHQDLPNDVIHALDPTRQVVSKLAKIRKRHARVIKQRLEL